VGGQEQKPREAEAEVEAGGRHRSAGLRHEKVLEKGGWGGEESSQHLGQDLFL